MDGNVIGFIIWTIVSCFIIGLGIRAFFSKKPVGFWANIEEGTVNDVKKYNSAVGKLFIVYGVVFDLLGLPMLAGQNSPYILLSIVGVLFATIAMMIIYILLIDKKYR